MSIIQLNDKYLRPVALAATGLYLCASVLFFLPVEIPHKITYCVAPAMLLLRFWRD
ncbi:MAG: hypothetical protein IJ394_08065 [Bacteroidales bacterium]|nr:hypothetical protein [Bacteroidales bacterium]